jgi:hypothetical protein
MRLKRLEDIPANKPGGVELVTFMDDKMRILRVPVVFI